MDDRVAQFRVGVLVLATMIIAAILVLVFGDSPGLVRSQYTIFVRFPQAPGVKPDTPVLKSGILIGRVRTVALQDDGGVVVELKIDTNRRLRDNEVCRIASGSLLGDAVLEFVPSSLAVSAPEEYQDGEYMDGIVAQDPLRVMESATTVLDMLSSLEQDVRSSLSSIELAGQRVGDVAENLGAVIENNEDQLRRIMTSAESAMNRFDEAVGAVDDLIGDEDFQVVFEQALEQVPELVFDARELIASLKGATARFDQNLRNIEGLTEPLGARGAQLADTVEQSVGQIEVILTQLVQFTQALNRDDGTLGQLLNNRQLYDQLTRSVSNIEEVSRRLRPIVEDARVFTDKIARDPSRLGVKGLLERSQSGIKR